MAKLQINAAGGIGESQSLPSDLMDRMKAYEATVQKQRKSDAFDSAYNSLVEEYDKYKNGNKKSILSVRENSDNLLAEIERDKDSYTDIYGEDRYSELYNSIKGISDDVRSAMNESLENAKEQAKAEEEAKNALPEFNRLEFEKTLLETDKKNAAAEGTTPVRNPSEPISPLMQNVKNGSTTTIEIPNAINDRDELMNAQAAFGKYVEGKKEEGKTIPSVKEEEVPKPTFAENALGFAQTASTNLALGAANTISSIVNGLEQAIGDAASGGAYSDGFKVLSDYFGAMPSELRTTVLAELGMEGNPNRPARLGNISRATGVSENIIEQYAKSVQNENMRESVYDSGYAENMNPALKKNTADIAFSIGQQIPGLMLSGALSGASTATSAVGSAIGANPSTVLIGMSVAGNEVFNLAREKGYNPSIYAESVMQGGIEMMLEGLLGFSDVASYQKLMSNTGSAIGNVAKSFIKYLVNGAEEGLEEVINVPLSNLVSNMFGADKKIGFGEGEVFDYKAMIESGMSGTAVGLIMGGVMGTSMAVSAVKEGADIRYNADWLNKMAQKLPEHYRPAKTITASKATGADVDSYAKELTAAFEKYMADSMSGNAVLTNKDKYGEDVASVTEDNSSVQLADQAEILAHVQVEDTEGAKEIIEQKIQHYNEMSEALSEDESLKEIGGEDTAEKIASNVAHLTETKDMIDAGTYNADEAQKAISVQMQKKIAEGKKTTAAAKQFAETVKSNLGVVQGERAIAHTVELLETDVKNGVNGASAQLKVAKKALDAIRKEPNAAVRSLLGNTEKELGAAISDSTKKRSVQFDYSMSAGSYASYNRGTGTVKINPMAVLAAQSQMESGNKARSEFIHEAGHIAAQMDSSFVSNVYDVYARLRDEGVIPKSGLDGLNEDEIREAYRKDKSLSNYLNTATVNNGIKQLVAQGATVEQARESFVDAFLKEEMAMHFLSWAENNGANLYNTIVPEKRNAFVEAMHKIAQFFRDIAAKIRKTDPASAKKMESLADKLYNAVSSFAEGSTTAQERTNAKTTENTTDTKSAESEGSTGTHTEDERKSLDIKSMSAESRANVGEQVLDSEAAESMTNEEAFEDSEVAVRYSIRPPYSDGSKAFNEFAEGLSPEAKETFDLFYGFYQRSRITNALSVSGKRVKGVNISSLYLRAQEWNDMLRADEKWRAAAKELADFLPKDIRERMRMNPDGTLNPNPLEEEFKMPSSLAQRLVDSLPYEMIDAEYKLGNKTITLPEGKARQSVGGEAYRRAIIEETRKLYADGKLKQVGIGTMSKDRWGSLGFLAANGKTGASGDFTTVCPQMMFNRGCWYCYRRAAMEKGVNNKLVANNVWYTGEILRIKDSDIKQLNENGGLRIQSFGDWMPHFSAMLADVLYDAEMRGLQVKIITKEPSMINYIAAIREQGIGKNLYFNLSADYTIEKATPGNGELDAVNPERPFQKNDEGFWWKRAMTVEEAAKYREKYPWVNTRIVATDVNEFIRGLKDSRVDVVTGYHGNIREFERVDSTTGEHKVMVEALGDAGMPRFAYNPATNEWVTEYEGKTQTHKRLAEAIASEGLQMEYYTKTCCITGRCASCKGKCGALARDFNVKNATNRDEESVAYWRKEMQYAIEPEFGDMTESADNFDTDERKSIATGTSIYIKDGHTADGQTVDFVNLILDGKKKGETRTHKSLTRKWVGIAKDGYVYGRVRFGEPYLIDKDSPEYADTYIEGTEYDIKDGEQKYYYPVLEVEDFRDNPKPITKHGNYAQYEYEDGVEDDTKDARHSNETGSPSGSVEVLHNGKPFWLAMVNQTTGDIVNTWTYKEAESRDFDFGIPDTINHLFFTTDLLQDNDMIEYDDYGERLPDHIIKRVNEQIEVRHPTKSIGKAPENKTKSSDVSEDEAETLFRELLTELGADEEFIESTTFKKWVIESNEDWLNTMDPIASLFEYVNDYKPARKREYVKQGKTRYTAGKLAEQDARKLYSIVDKLSKAAKQYDDIRYSVESDSAYMSAVKRGDMAEVQRMVDEAAKAAGYSTPNLYHGTQKFGFTKPNTKYSDDGMSFFATSDIGVAQTYSATDGVRHISDKLAPRKNLYDLDSFKAIDDLIKKYDSSMSIDSLKKSVLDELTRIFESANSEAERILGYKGYWDNDHARYVADKVVDYLSNGAIPGRLGAIGVVRDNLDEMNAELYGHHSPTGGNYKFYGNTSGFVEIDANGANWSAIDFTPPDVQDLWDEWETLTSERSAWVGRIRKYALDHDIPMWEAEDRVPGYTKYLSSVEDIESRIEKARRDSGLPDEASTRQIASWAKKQGYKGVVIKNVWDDGGRGHNEQLDPADIYIFFDPQSQLKSADPITYDDNGNVIPLSERFNPLNDDIRYSMETDKTKKRIEEDRAFLDKEFSNAIKRIDDDATEHRKKVGEGLIKQYNLDPKTAPEKLGAMLVLLEKQSELLERAKTNTDQKTVSKAETSLANLNRRIHNMALELVEESGGVDVELIRNENDDEGIRVIDEQAQNLEMSAMLAYFPTDEDKAKSVGMNAYKARLNSIRAGVNRRLDRYAARLSKQADRIADLEDEANIGQYRATVEKRVKAMLSMANNPNKKRFVEEKNRDSVRYLAKWLDDVAETTLESSDISSEDVFNEERINTVKARISSLSEELGEDGVKVANILVDQIAINKESGMDNEVSQKLALGRMMKAEKNLSYMLYKTLRERNRVIIGNKMVEAASVGTDITETLDKRLLTQKQFDSLANAPKSKKIWNTVFNHNLSFTDAYSFFHRMGKAGDNIYETLRDAQSRQYLYIKQYTDKVSDALSDVDLSQYAGEKQKTVSITLTNGKAYTLTAAQAMNIVTLYERSSGKSHIENGGVRIYNPKTRQASTATALTEKDIASLRNALDDTDKKVMHVLADFMRDECTAWGNEATMEKYGFHRFTTKDYFPISVDKTAIGADMKTYAPAQFNVENVGFAKSTKDDASAPVMIDSMIDVANNHIRGMASYAAYLNVEDGLNRIMKVPGVADAMKRALGSDAQKYITEMMNDLKGAGKTEELASNTVEILNKFAGRYKAAAVSYNASTVAKQPLSYFRAAAVIDAKYLAKGVAGNHKTAYDEMMKHSGIAVRKEIGYSDVGVGKTIGEQIGYTESGTLKSGVRKFNEFGMAGAALADRVTWESIWLACKAEQLEKNASAAVDRDALMDATAKRFEEVVAQTQVVDSALDSAPVSRSNNPLVRLTYAFMSEPIKGYNLFVNALDDLINSADENAKKRAAKHLARVSAYTIIGWAAEAAITSAFSAIRDDDDDFFEKFSETYFGNLAQNAAGIIPQADPLVDMLHEVFNGYTPSNMADQTITDVASTIIDAIKTCLNPEGKRETRPKAIRDAVESVFTMLGVPVKNIARMVNNTAKSAFHITNAYKASYGLQKIWYNPNNVTAREKNGFNSILADAYLSGDRDAFEYIYEDMRKMGLNPQQIVNSIAKDSFEDDIADKDKSTLVKYKPGSDAWYIGMKTIFNRDEKAPKATEDEITRVYKETKETSVLPKFKSGEYTVDGKEKEFKGDALDKYLEDYGSLYYEIANAMRDLAAYRKGTAQEQAWWLTKAEKFASASAIYSQDKEYSVTSVGKWAADYIGKKPADVAKYIVANLSK